MTTEKGGKDERMSESEDDDSAKPGSGNESINKSLAHIMEAEAHQKKNG